MQLPARTVQDFTLAVDELAELDRLDCADNEFAVSLQRDAILYAFMRCLITIKGLLGDLAQLNDHKTYAEIELFDKLKKRLSTMFSAQELATLQCYVDMADYLEVIAGTQDEAVIQDEIEIISGMPLIVKTLRKYVDRFSDSTYIQLVQEA